MLLARSVLFEMNTNSMRWLSLLLLFVGGAVSAQPTPPASTQPYQAQVLIVNPTVPSRTLKEFIALGKARPGQLSYGSGGTGGGIHIPTELFNNMTGIKMVHVPYKGGAPALIDLVGGQIDLVFQPVPEAISYIKSGRVRALGVTSPKHEALLPQVPTIAEAGVPGYAYVGLMGAAGDGQRGDQVGRWKP